MQADYADEETGTGQIPMADVQKQVASQLPGGGPSGLCPGGGPARPGGQRLAPAGD